MATKPTKATTNGADADETETTLAGEARRAGSKSG